MHRAAQDPERPWDGSASKYTDEQYQRACALDRRLCGGDIAKAPPKLRCSLPYKTPTGEISRDGVIDATQRLATVTGASQEAIDAAKAKLRDAYKSLGEEPPASLGESPKSLDIDPDSVHRERALAEIDGSWEFRSDSKSAGSLGTLTGHFAVFDRWTEISSMFEGRFMERIAPGAFEKTFKENRSGMRVLLNHGRDPSVGMKPLGPIRALEEDKTGARYEVELLDTSYNRDLLPGLEAGLFGASFRFQIMREELNNRPERSTDNPEGIPESTILEAKVREFGPVTFPAYEDATAGLRSLNDELIGLDLRMMASADPRGVARFTQALTGMADLSRPAAPLAAALAPPQEPAGAPQERQEEGEPPTEPAEPTEPPKAAEAATEPPKAPETSRSISSIAPAPEAPDRTRKPYGSTLTKRAAPLRHNRKAGEPSWKL